MLFIMNNHRLKKKTIHNDTRSSIKNQENKFFETLQKNKESLPKKKLELSKLITKYEQTSNTDMRYDIRKEIEDLTTFIHETETNKLENEYYINFYKFVENERNRKESADTTEFYNDDADFFKKTSTNCRGAKYNNYMAYCFNSVQEPIFDDCDDDLQKIFVKRGGTTILFCKYCKDTNLIIDNQTATAICPECGISIHYTDETYNPEFREGVQIVSPYAYKRINHFKEWLAQLQAKETTEIPDEVINNILAELKKQRVTDSDKVTTTKIRSILKKLRYNKFYEHIPTITHRITGRPAPRLSQELETRLINMFREIQEPFAKWVKIEAPDRKNFLSYSYTLNKMCRLLGETELVQFFPLLKSRDKNYVQDKIWKGICQDLDWEFTKSV